MALGCSVHDASEVDAVDPPDWYLLGTIWPTASHPGREGSGTGAISAAAAATRAPVVAIGGVTPGRSLLARRAGAAGVAAMRGIWDARDTLRAADEYLSAWNEA